MLVCLNISFQTFSILEPFFTTEFVAIILYKYDKDIFSHTRCGSANYIYLLYMGFFFALEKLVLLKLQQCYNLKQQVPKL